MTGASAGETSSFEVHWTDAADAVGFDFKRTAFPFGIFSLLVNLVDEVEDCAESPTGPCSDI